MLLLLKKIDIHVVLMLKSVHLAIEDVFLYTAGLGKRFCPNLFFWKFCILQFIHRFFFFKGNPSHISNALCHCCAYYGIYC